MRSFTIGLIISIVLASSFFIYAYSEASSPKYRGDDYYVSDEVWYVTSSRNLLHEVFGLHPKYSIDGYVFATLSFNSESDLMEHLDDLDSLLRSIGGEIVRANYTATGDRIAAIWVMVPESNSSKLEVGYAKVRYGFEYPSKSGILEYLNLEHPPLGKYIIMLSMMILGDSPANWRFPGILEGSIIIILVYLTVSRLLNPFWGVVASIAIALDPIFYAMSMVAMLDIHLTFFTALCLLFLVYDRPLAASISSWLSFSVKFSGLFSVACTYLYLRIYRGERPLRALAISILPSLVYLALSIPLISYLGPERWIQENLNAIAWHTTSRGSGPTPSPPWAWFFNLAPMALHVNPDLIARVNFVSYIFSFVFTILLFPLMLKRERLYIPMMMILSIVLGYTAVYIAGNRTLYSFYAVQLSPSVASAFSISLFYLMREDLGDIVRREWRFILDRLFRDEIELPEEIKPFLSLKGRSFYMLNMVLPVLISIIMHHNFYLPGSPVFSTNVRDFGLSGILNDFLMRSSDKIWVRELIFSSITVISALIISLDLAELSAYPIPISLLVLSGYDWTLLSLALALESISLMRGGRRIISISLALISCSLNPINILLFPLIFRKRISTIFAASLIPLSLLSWPEEGTNGLLQGLAGAYAPTIALTISITLTAYLMRYSIFWSSVLGMGFMTLLSGIKQPWGLTALALVSSSPSIPLIELLLSLSLITYNNPSLLSGILFKCNPSGPKDACSDPSISMALFSLSIIYLGLRGLYRENKIKLEVSYQE
ncbi:phospholipid carrier-dependent glycosyltransferase [Candidatus Korarchaeum cryptofilum]|jgi:predicted membrane-bound dolichyl-phosphate-mannose-protein mannosyltransferase|uniref:Phospholipid carrier-dependent glycosyltransferase n=1 Tax=Candidatus Korarchaeum cryptofilum TaxID=498846 RepID=A0A3R9QQY7_9CREN|nr:glycosyltransferase family 39 protein [Candidatus Korarchaeum cryptofilum]RSN67393.1 phospholipid carrier-dependent glycosyltransferase [Candidatus Korarchaeum cryptofilum]